MNGFTRLSAAALFVGGLMAFQSGCYSYRQHVDPCWPERYNNVSRLQVNYVMDTQAMNGHILDQTIWNYHFEVKDVEDPVTKLRVYLPTAKLNNAGLQHLKYLARRRPMPDPKLYLQTAQDLPLDAPIEKLAQLRNDLDAQRTAAVRSAMAILVANRAHPIEFEVAIHDPAPVGIQALPISGAIRPAPTGAMPDLYNNFKGSIPLSIGNGSQGSAQ